MGKFKSLAGDTIVYGGGTILVRLLNWLLMPYYIRTMDSVQYGVVTEMYSYIAIFIVVLTYGFETSFFRFAKKKSFTTVFTTGFSSIVSTGLIFLLIVYLFGNRIEAFKSDLFSNELIMVVSFIIFFDILTALVFAKIRLEGKSLKFALIKFLNVVVLISFNLYFLYWCPQHFNSNFFRFIDLHQYQHNEAFYVFLSNLFASISVFIFLIPDIVKSLGSFSFSLLKTMFRYSYPILIVGISGMVNQNIDKILLPRLISGDEGYSQLAIYAANFKIGILMAMFTQSFRLAFEPFFFKHHSDTNDTTIYAKVLNYFVLFGFLIFLGVTFFMDIINIVLTKSYIEGNIVIPIVLLSQLLSGIYFALSVWYKVSDKTIFGAYMGIIGSIVTLLANYLLIPYLGYLGSAISGFICFFIMVSLSIFWGRKHFFISYDWNKLFNYSLLVISIFFIGYYFWPNIVLNQFPLSTFWFYILDYLMRISLIIVFLVLIFIKEFRNKTVFLDVNTN